MVAKHAVKKHKASTAPPHRVRAEEVIIEDAVQFAGTGGAHDATIGRRIQQARLNVNATQLGLSKIVGLGRSAIAQWERGDSLPNVAQIQIIARFLKVSPEWLAFGINNDPIIVEPSPEKLGYVVAQEVRFGAGPDDRTPTQNWALPFNWLRGEMGMLRPEEVILYRAQITGGGVTVGERVIVDTSEKRLRRINLLPDQLRDANPRTTGSAASAHPASVPGTGT